jgi:hypothetical protein
MKDRNKLGSSSRAEKSKDRTPLAQRLKNSNFFKKGDGENETEIYAPSYKPHMTSSDHATTEHADPQTKHCI